MTLSVTLWAAALVLGAITCAVAARFSQQARKHTDYQPSLAERLAFLVVGFGCIGCLGGAAYLEMTRPLTADELAAAKWSSPEWTEVGANSGIFRIPAYRQLTARDHRIESEEFPEILARFKQKHPDLEIVSTAAMVRSSGESSYTDYFTVITKPRGK